MSSDDRERRAYEASNLPTLRSDADPAAQREVRLALYESVCTTWRALPNNRVRLTLGTAGRELIDL